MSRRRQATLALVAVVASMTIALAPARASAAPQGDPAVAPRWWNPHVAPDYWDPHVAPDWHDPYAAPQMWPFD